MTLYLKYRPQTFADVVGQDHVVTTLEHAIDRNSIAHAYLFCGSRGTGKTSVARILAKTILLRECQNPTLQTHITKGIEDGSFVDLIEIDAASNRRIDDVRDLIEKIGFSPSIATAKVYIIDEVHMLTKEAFNALLKTLEEPPPYAYFILATTELHRVPPTIQSRCQRFLFKRVKEDDIIRRLQYIADQEHITTDREALRAMARHAQGSFRDGIALLDQLRSLEKISVADVTERVGKTSAGFLEDLLEGLRTENKGLLAETVRKMEEANIPLDTVTADLLGNIRETMHSAVAQNEPLQPILRTIDTLLTTLRDMRASPLPGMVLEGALLALCNGDSPAPARQRVRSPKATAAPTAPIATPAVQTEDGKESRAKPQTVEAEELTVPNVLRHWEEVLRAVSTPSVRMSLKDASVSDVRNATVHLSFGSSFHRDKLADTKASRMVEAALTTIFKSPVRIACRVETNVLPTQSGTSTDLAEAAQEVFGKL